MRGIDLENARKYYCRIIESPLGRIGIVWFRLPEKIKIVRVILPVSPKKFERIVTCYRPHKDSIDPRIDRIACDIMRFIKGSDITFSIRYLDVTHLSRFQKMVLWEEKKIPRGRVSTYKRLAQTIGMPRAARAVGNALANNPFPIIIPCHRTVRTDGCPGGFQGGPVLKRRLLELEGVRFQADGRVLPELFL